MQTSVVDVLSPDVLISTEDFFIRFISSFRSNAGFVYRIAFERAVLSGTHYMCVDLFDVARFSSDLHDRIVRDPFGSVSKIEKALSLATKDPLFLSSFQTRGGDKSVRVGNTCGNEFDSNNGFNPNMNSNSNTNEPINATPSGGELPFSVHFVHNVDFTSFRAISSVLNNSLVRVRGLIVSVAAPVLKVTALKLVCPVCLRLVSNGFYGMRCFPECGSSKLLVSSDSVVTTEQVCRAQELFCDVPPGDVPACLRLVFSSFCVDFVRGGDLVDLTGVVRVDGSIVSVYVLGVVVSGTGDVNDNISSACEAVFARASGQTDEITETPSSFNYTSKEAVNIKTVDLENLNQDRNGNNDEDGHLNNSLLKTSSTQHYDHFKDSRSLDGIHTMDHSEHGVETRIKRHINRILEDDSEALHSKTYEDNVKSNLTALKAVGSQGDDEKVDAENLDTNVKLRNASCEPKLANYKNNNEKNLLNLQAAYTHPPYLPITGHFKVSNPPTSAVFHLLILLTASHVHGHFGPKRAVLCSLFGGTARVSGGTHLRGDIHCLLLGDPGCAKSALLRYAHAVSPGTLAAGGGASAAGLTAAVIRRPTGELCLEGGALVLADGGICCVDEFDKMSQRDAIAMHEAMEQQTVTITKAGLNATLRTRCAVIAAANPTSGRFDPTKSLQANITLGQTLLSRFDNVFIVRDESNSEKDTRLARHMLGLSTTTKYQQSEDCFNDDGSGSYMSYNQTNDSEKVFKKYSSYKLQNSINSAIYTTHDDFGKILEAPSIFQLTASSPYYNKTPEQALKMVDPENIFKTPIEFMKKYIQYARKSSKPTLTKEAGDKLARFYEVIRKNTKIHKSPIKITVRQLESLIRMAESLARMELTNKATIKHVDEAIRIFSESTLKSNNLGIQI